MDARQAGNDVDDGRVRTWIDNMMTATNPPPCPVTADGAVEGRRVGIRGRKKELKKE